ncbi:HTH domain-containing protein [Anseongella ginsenosidimutans]|uniref:HTH domain-containing protein n=1 Tax=Anseongella ginsenosidimutans TaxID=496056 RepID=A0A4V2UT57_9SPHI|nr:HTH domain-containing protein [Anseongella ginsenosidimutans]TCS84259.1 HTH domain-containing protein [Anseongella ginsenosidimutans]
MPNNEPLNRLEYLNDLIRKKSTGSPKELAEKLNISQTTVFNWINMLRDLGALIKYDSERQTYFYEETT